MLNEIWEYALYLSDGYGGLLRKDNLSSGLSGVRDAMTVLARGFLDRCAQCGINDIERRHRYTRVFLKAWTAGADIIAADEDTMREIEDFPALYHDVAQALRHNLTDHLIQSDITLEFFGKEQGPQSGSKKKKVKIKGPDAIKKTMENKAAVWDHSMFSNGQKDSQNQMYYKALIADALNKGPLTNRVLVLRKLDRRFGLGGKFAEANSAYMLGVVSTYLQTRPDGQTSAPVVMTRLSNYTGLLASSKGAGRICLPQVLDASAYTYNGQPLFTKIDITGGNRKLVVNSEWLQDMEVHLEDADEMSSSYAYVRLSDTDIFPNRFRTHSPSPTLAK